MRAIAKASIVKILKEQFIPDTVFLYVAKGAISFFDGNKSCTLKTGQCCIARKNRLVKFVVSESKDEFEPIMFCFDEEFLQQFQKKYKSKAAEFKPGDAFIKIPKTALMQNFIRSLKPYHKAVMQLDADFEDLKYEELLIILLKSQPELAGVFFDFGIPQKINLEAYMNRHFNFNVSMRRFAYLTGRSLSAFKRDFKIIFDDAPGHWLVTKRLREAYFLIDNKHEKPSDIYLDLGFESLSHFSVAFKKMFGRTPTDLLGMRKAGS